MKRLLCLILALTLCLTMIVPTLGAELSSALDETALYLQTTVPDPQVGSIGGEWAVIGLARGGYAVPEGYYDTVVSYVEACGGVLHERKYTEYSRVILALTAIGKDPTDVAGYDLTLPLGDFEKTVYQGINGPIWALIALDSADYPCDQRQAYLDYILEKEIVGGGWALAGSTPDPDITGMALQALAKYQSQPAVKAATDRALTWLSENQNSDGSYSTAGDENCESTVQVLVALCELGLSVEDSRFVKNGCSTLDGLMEYYSEGGGFTHVKGGGNGNDGMSTEQGFYALVALDRANRGRSSLYRMSASASLSDIAGHPNQAAIEALVAKEIINGMGDGTFAPDATMTRAQYCTIVVKALGLTPAANSAFTDVAPSAWYAGYVGTASAAGIVNGVGGGKFDPEGTITRQEAATMVARAAKTLSVDTAVTDARSVLSVCTDGAQVSDWAKDAVAFCYQSGIMTGTAIQPTKAILRCEIAQMIYNLLQVGGRI